MRILFLKSTWEFADEPLEPIAERVKAAGFDGIEVHIGGRQDTPELLRTVLAHQDLRLVTQIATGGTTPGDHLRSLEEQFAFAAACGPLLINCHAGRDYFRHDENLRLLRHGMELSRRYGVRIAYETHRGRPTYSAIDTRKLLAALPDLRLTADFSHWMVVHESDLTTQEDNVQSAIDRSDHIHARIGFEQGPQVNDPSAPEWAGHARTYLGLWRRIAAQHAARGSEVLTITPEFGPPPYMPTLPFTQAPTADVWEANVYLKDWLKGELERRAP